MKVLMENWRKFVNEEFPPDFSKLKVEPVVDFLNSPEGQDPKVRAMLGRGTQDGHPGDEVIEVNEDAKPLVGKLFPTQREISLMKSIGWPLSTLDSVTNSLTGDITGKGKKIVTAGNLVIDGHHRWSSTWATAGKNPPINAVDVQFPGARALNKLAVAQVAIAATMDPDAGNIPSASAGDEDDPDAASDNILGKKAPEIKAMILQRRGQPTEGGVLLGDEYLQKITGVPAAQKLWGLKPGMSPEQTMNTIVNVVATNLSQLPPPQGPVRDYMPQFDGGETHKGQVSLGGVVKKMQSGDVNYKAAYAAAEKAKE
jgi:hypothetical protein